MNKFQIIVPTKNSYKILSKLIKSLQDQTYNNWSVIFIDGKSNFDHIKWLKRICSYDKRFIYIKQTHSNKGIFGAMNQGLETIDEKSWVLFWGSDDWAMEKDTFKKLNMNINKKSNRNLDLIICKGKYFQLKGNFFKNAHFTNHSNSKKIQLKEYKKLLLCGFTPPHQATLINKRLFTSNFKYNDQYELAGDLDFFCRLSNKNKLKILLLNTYIVSISCGGVSSKNHLKRFWEVIKSYYSFNKKLFFFPFFIRYFLKILKIV